jgi:peptidyl-prolyl cis-trans isomerase SurA
MPRQIALLALPSLLLAAPAPADILERIIAKVNGEIITQSEFQSRQLAAAQAAHIDPDKVGAFLRDNNAKILQEAVDDLLLVQRAEEAGLHLRPEYIKDVIDGIKKENNIASDEQLQEQLRREGMSLDDLKRNIERSILRRQILTRDLESKTTITDAEARADYEAHLSDYHRPASVKLQEILVRAEGGGALAKAKEIVARARAGEDFATLAKQNSAAPSRAAGGDLGKIVRGEMNPELEKAAFALPPGGVSEPIPSGEDYRVLKVTEKTEASVLSFDEAKADIKQLLTQGRWDKELAAYVEGLRKKAIIDLRVREVPLELTGPVPSGNLLGGTGLGETGHPAATPAPPAAGTPAPPPAHTPPPPPGAASPDSEFVTSPQSAPEHVVPPSSPAQKAPEKKKEKEEEQKPAPAAPPP